jgi:hypothetical protein
MASPSLAADAAAPFYQPREVLASIAGERRSEQGGRFLLIAAAR